MDTETIQAIMMEVPGTWASIINSQYQKMLREFQNAVKYHEESLEKLEAPVLQPPYLPNRNILAHASLTARPTSTSLGGPKILELLRFPRMIVISLLGKPPTLWARDLVDIVEAGSIGIMSVDIRERERN